jgi:hypothetical protein
MEKKCQHGEVLAVPKEFKNLTQVAMYIRHKETRAELIKGHTLHIYYDKERKLFIVETTEFEN